MMVEPAEESRSARVVRSSRDVGGRSRHAAIKPPRAPKVLAWLQIGRANLGRQPALALGAALIVVVGGGAAGMLAYDPPAGDPRVHGPGHVPQKRVDPAGVEGLRGNEPGAQPVPDPQPVLVTVPTAPEVAPSPATDLGAAQQGQPEPDLAALVQSLAPPEMVDQDLQQALADLDGMADRDELIRRQQERVPLAQAEGPSSAEMPIEHVPAGAFPAPPGPG